MTFNEIVLHFDAKRVGTSFMARCPAHEDDTASLGLSQNDGKVLLHCFAGCATEDILRAKNLTTKDLFESNGNGRRPSPVVATYDYHDLTGPLFLEEEQS